MSLGSKKAEAKIRASKLGSKTKARNREINRERESRGLVLLLTKITHIKSSLVNLPFEINSKELEGVNSLRTSKKMRSIILGDYLTILVATIPPKLEFKLVSASSSRLDYIPKTLVYTVDKA